jgi:hypothetical protein
MNGFTGGLSVRERMYIGQLARCWKNQGVPQRVPMDAVSVEGRKEIWPGTKHEIALLDGAGVIRSLWLNVPFPDPEALDQIHLAFYWDGEETPSVQAPLGAFFGTGFGARRFRSAPVGMREDGLYCRFLMPFARGARLILENRSSRKHDVEWAVDYYQLEELPAWVGRFHARAHESVTRPGIPHTILETTGVGQYVGCALNVDGATDFSFLEGDEEIYVDGETEPSLHGTGTEDYFNGAYYFVDGVFHLPWHGLTVKEWTDKKRISAYRFHFIDYIPFRSSFWMTLEHGARNDAPGLHYSSVAFWYQF